MPLPDAAEFPYVALRELQLDGVRAYARGDYIAVNNVGVTGRLDPGTGKALSDPEWELGEDYAERDSEAADEAIQGPQRPAANASKGEWVAYAVALHDAGDPFGLAVDVAEGMTRDQIAAHTAGEAG